jgi:hypothetical protein
MILTRLPRPSNGEGQPFKEMVVEKTQYPHAKA